MSCFFLVNYLKTSNYQRLGSAFDVTRLSLLTKLVMMSSAPAKCAWDARYASQDPFIHGNQRCPIQSRLQSVLGARFFYVDLKYVISLYFFSKVDKPIVSLPLTPFAANVSSAANTLANVSQVNFW